MKNKHQEKEEEIRKAINQANDTLYLNRDLTYEENWLKGSQDIMTKEEALEDWYTLLSSDDMAKRNRTMEEFVEEETIQSTIKEPENGETIVDTENYYVWIDRGGYIGLIKK